MAGSSCRDWAAVRFGGLRRKADISHISDRDSPVGGPRGLNVRFPLEVVRFNPASAPPSPRRDGSVCLPTVPSQRQNLACNHQITLRGPMSRFHRTRDRPGRFVSEPREPIKSTKPKNRRNRPSESTGPSYRHNSERFYTAWVTLRHSQPCPKCPKLGDKQTSILGGRMSAQTVLPQRNRRVGILASSSEQGGAAAERTATQNTGV